MNKIVSSLAITDETKNNPNDIIDDNDEQHIQSKIIKCKTNNQQTDLSSYNVLTENGTTSTTIHSIDVPNEHTSIKLHIRRVCSPSPSPPTDTLS
ncbi:unnamed protein product, partial [Rotaria magnacalcarata]